MLVVAALTLAVWNIWAQDWVALVSTVLTLICVVAGWASSRRRRQDRVAERRTGA